jgi:hypothetical protein
MGLLRSAKILSPIDRPPPPPKDKPQIEPFSIALKQLHEFPELDCHTKAGEYVYRFQIIYDYRSGIIPIINNVLIMGQEAHSDHFKYIVLRFKEGDETPEMIMFIQGFESGFSKFSLTTINKKKDLDGIPAAINWKECAEIFKKRFKNKQIKPIIPDFTEIEDLQGFTLDGRQCSITILYFEEEHPYTRIVLTLQFVIDQEISYLSPPAS